MNTSRFWDDVSIYEYLAKQIDEYIKKSKFIENHRRKSKKSKS